MSEIQPTYLSSSCPGISNYSRFSQFETNLQRLLIRRLYGQGSIYGFFNDTEGENPDKVYGLFLCRGDVQPNMCQSCIDAASAEIVKECAADKEAIIYYDACLVRYSYRSFFSIMELSPSIYMYNIANVTDFDKFEKSLAETFDNLTTKLSNASNHMYATTEVNVSSFMTLYGLVQCTPDLLVADCQSCLRSSIAAIPSFATGKQGARVLRPSCNIRYEIYPFYGKPRDESTNTAIIKNPGVESEAPPPSVNKTSGSNVTDLEGGKQGESKWIPIVASLSAIFGVTLFCSGGIFLWRRRNFQENIDHNSQEVQLLEFGGRVSDGYSNENFQGESGVRSKEFPSIRLDILQTATKQFCDENKLGVGGFGPVYKGKLADGKEIAVKRLSRTSGQGLLEFKNEVMLIARLQHRNLVRLLGCCLEQNEKLLVYEYMPNKSLDVFLFDSSIGVQLDWQKRLSIINGIARGILYLHEDSRLRIIHRDLKASNVLLDHEMNPKISDFGMARIFGGNQNEANTNRVVGTYGYMAPEYAMEGLFSVKSDVFSFGVLLLEIISGRRNNGFHLSEHGESLLTFAWKLWSKGQGMELIDPLLVQSCVPTEVLKCIHIGLLCVQEDPADRPTMSSVIVMLASETLTLPLPSEPAFSVGRVVAEPIQSTSNDRVCSVNEVTISNVSPR
ncbi:putative receptor-like protein kinase At4g00960 isoform X1 [Durio zibethinus]|uniref:non-specific serine/threonine protein kinase n=1 Tax=Durio zibethinus TaxID=66656 RepID=A0A6P5WY68_DURZI|nr:putative receptor-like protein kinase At4g00960 isoform X1 [Durio zibethinus]